MTYQAPGETAQPLAAPKPRRAFLFMGVLLAAVLGVGLFTTLGTKKNSGAPHAGGAVPSFSASRLDGSGDVSVPSDGGGNGTPAVLMFFGNWCTICHSELPPIAAVVHEQEERHGPLSIVRVIGVDSEDTKANATSFIHRSGVTFPVAYDPDLTITSGDFYFQGDPYVVFVNANGTIRSIVAGPISVTKFLADEEKLTPNGS